MRNEEKVLRRMGIKPFKPASMGHQGIVVDGKRYTRFSQFRTKPAGKKTLKEKVAGGIRLAIL